MEELPNILDSEGNAHLLESDAHSTKFVLEASIERTVKNLVQSLIYRKECCELVGSQIIR